MPEKADTVEVIKAFFGELGYDFIVRKDRYGYSMTDAHIGLPVARLRTGENGRFEVMWWSDRMKWEHIGDFGGEFMTLNEALPYIANDEFDLFLARTGE